MSRPSRSPLVALAARERAPTFARMTLGLEGFAEDAEIQAAYFATRGHALYVDLMRVAAAWAKIPSASARSVDAAWRGRHFSRGYERPLLLAAALRDQALEEADTPLARLLGDGTRATEFPREVFEAALAPGAKIHAVLAERFVQTNEVSRAVAWRWPLATLLADAPRVHLVDLGASAGLNLVADRLALAWTDTRGVPLPVLGPPIGERHGLDRSPLDVRRADERRWLRACIWPFEAERLARLDAAFAAAAPLLQSGELRLHPVHGARMPVWLEAATARLAPDPIVAYQTVFSAYLPADERARYEADMLAWTARYPTRALWIELEDARPEERAAAPELPAVLRLHRAGETRVLALLQHHPKVLHVVTP